MKPWDDSSGVIRPTVEVEEFCQSCPEAAHPHTSYVNNLYVYPLALNYSNQKVFSKVNSLLRFQDHAVLSLLNFANFRISLNHVTLAGEFPCCLLSYAQKLEKLKAKLSVKNLHWNSPYNHSTSTDTCSRPNKTRNLSCQLKCWGQCNELYKLG